MTAVDDYQAGTSDFNRDADHRMLSEIAGPAHFVMRLADAAIAELEAELAALKARRCETCDDGDAVMGTEDEPRVYCGWHSSWWPSNAYCSQWSKREDTP